MGMERKTWKTILAVLFVIIIFVLIFVKPMLAVIMFLIVMMVGIGAKIRKKQGHTRPPKNQEE